VASDDPRERRIREGRCRLALIDREAGLVAFRCEGNLVQAVCGSQSAAIFKEWIVDRTATCADGGRALVVLANLGAAPSDACVAGARAALGTPKQRFSVAGTAALDACARDLQPPDPSEDDGAHAHALLEEEALLPTSRALIHRVLERQRRLLPPVALPRRCRDVGGPCVADADEDYVGRVVARGCGAKV